MKLEEVRPGVVRLTLHVAELGNLVSAARLVGEGDGTRLPSGAASRLAEVLRRYDREVARLHARATRDAETPPERGLGAAGL